MKIIISPAKKMNIRPDLIPAEKTPVFLEQAEQLKTYMKTLDYSQAKEMWRCNDTIAELNYKRFQEMDLSRNLTPAVLSYEGLQYQHMAPAVLEDRQWVYLKKHLRILSGFYGLLAPCDGVVPYRLEMQANIHMAGSGGTVTNLYDYWGDRMYRELVRENKVILNLASREYSKAIEPYLDRTVQYITCIFGERTTDNNGTERIKVKGTVAKMLRGEMVRFMAENGIEDLQELKRFSYEEYQFCSELSTDRELIFCKVAND